MFMVLKTYWVPGSELAVSATGVLTVCQRNVSLFQIVPVLLSVIRKISAVRLYLPSDLRSRDNRQSVLKSIQEVERRFPDGVPLLDPIQDMGIKDPQLKEIVQKIEAFEHRFV